MSGSYIHILVEIPPKLYIYIVICWFLEKGKTSIMIYQKYGNVKFKYRNRKQTLNVGKLGACIKVLQLTRAKSLLKEISDVEDILTILIQQKKRCKKNSKIYIYYIHIRSIEKRMNYLNN